MIYTRATLKSDINRGIHGKKGLLIDMDDLCNEAVREVLTQVRLRSTRRRASLVPNLFSKEYEYAAPSDLADYAVIDIPQQAKREDGEFNLIPSEQFARWGRLGDIAINDYNGIRVLNINSRVQDQSIVLDPLTQVVSNGASWTVMGGATSLDSNTDDYVVGSASLEFALSAASTTTAGITLTTTASYSEDLSDYIGHSASIFVWARITSITGLTNYKLRLGTTSGDYYEYTVTTKNDGTAFTTGYNLLRFDLVTPTSTTGSPDSTDIRYKAIFMTKLTSKVSESGYMFNYMVAKKGKYANVLYYSKYGWQDSSGTYIENSTADSDLLNADTDEYDLFVKKGRELASAEADEPVAISRSGRIVNPLLQKYQEAVTAYQQRNPSEEKIMISTYYDYGDRSSTYGGNTN